MMSWFRDSQDAIDDMEARARETQTNLDALDVLEEMPKQLERSEREIFRDVMKDLRPHERGEWGEQMVLDEARSLGHRILLEHNNAVTTPGYDCVSWDGRRVHVWEAKNLSASENGQARDVSNLNAVAPERRWTNLKHFLRHIRDDLEHDSIREAVRQHRWELHIRYGPDTNVPGRLMDQLQGPWEGKVDERQYTYAEVLRIRGHNR
jgi:hypothetical protein